MDPQKLSPQELVQLCLDSQDHASWTEFVRRFQTPITTAIARSICYGEYYRQKCCKYPSIKPSVLTNLWWVQSKLLSSLTYGVDMTWTL